MRLIILLAGLFALLTVQASEFDQALAISSLKRSDSLLIDVRSADEFAEGALAGAIRISHDDIAAQIIRIAPEKDRPLILYCRSGRRSALAQQSLEAMGYSQVINAGAYEELRPLLDKSP